MKRIAATLLSASLLLSLVGCSKEAEETTKKKKKKKTTSTEVTETVAPTETPEETTTEETTEETTTETTTEATTEPTVSPFDEKGHSIQLHSQIYPSCLAYGDVVEGDYGYSYMQSIRFYQEMISLGDPGYTALNDVLTENFHAIYAEISQQFPESLQVFLNGESPDITGRTILEEIYRDDSFIFSYAERQRVSRGDNTYPGDVFVTHNYLSATAQEIAFTDVVKDPQLVVDALAKQMREDKEPDPDLVASILDGSCAFVLYYDGIGFCHPYENNPIKVPLFDIEAGVDLSYFGHAPENYILDLDHHGEAQYDVNGDGQPNFIKAEVTMSPEEYSMQPERITLSFDGVTTELDPKDCGNMYGDWDPYYEPSYFLHIDSGYYVYLPVSIENDYIHTYVFQLDPDTGSFTYVDMFEPEFSHHPYDVDFVSLYSRFDVMGTCFMDAHYSLNQTDAIPQLLDYNYENYRTLVKTKAELSAYDGDGNDITIPAGKILLFLTYNTETRMAQVAVLDEDMSKWSIAIMSADDSSYPPTVAGKPQNDVLDGLFYGG